VDGFILALLNGEDGAHTSYAQLFHLGLFAGEEVEATGGVEVRGDPTFGFYHASPGEIVLEVSAPKWKL
jgi:hypothetical protein